MGKMKEVFIFRQGLIEDDPALAEKGDEWFMEQWLLRKKELGNSINRDKEGGNNGQSILDDEERPSDRC